MSRLTSWLRRGPAPYENLGRQSVHLSHRADHVRPPSIWQIKRTKPKNARIGEVEPLLPPARYDDQVLSRLVWGWVVRVDKDPEHPISYEGVPHHAWYAFHVEDRPLVGFMTVDFSGWVHDDSPGTRYVAKLQAGEALPIAFSEGVGLALPAGYFA